MSNLDPSQSSGRFVTDHAETAQSLPSRTRPFTTIHTTTVPGPWRSRYKVSAQTLAVNLAQMAQIREVSPEEACTILAQHPDDGSINGFWSKQFRKLNDTQRGIVVEHAKQYDDPFEMFDGQIDG